MVGGSGRNGERKRLSIFKKSDNLGDMIVSLINPLFGFGGVGIQELVIIILVLLLIAVPIVIVLAVVLVTNKRNKKYNPPLPNPSEKDEVKE